MKQRLDRTAASVRRAEENTINVETIPIQSGYLSFDKGKVHCLRMGRGKILLLAFHGVGNSAMLFKPLAGELADTHTLLAIDLPGHGQTRWSGNTFTDDDLMAIVYSVKLHYQVERLELLGYSLGGKLALTVAQNKPLWISVLYLVAPDGIRKNFWYHFATRNRLGRHLFNRVPEHPQTFLKIARLFHKLRLLSRNHLKTTAKVLSRPAALEQIRKIWPMYSAIPVPDAFDTFNKALTPLHLICGKHDRIFPYAAYKTYIKRFKNGHFHLLESGHLLLHPNWASSVAHIIRRESGK